MRRFRSLIFPAVVLALATALSACATLKHSPEIQFADPASVGLSGERLAAIETGLQPIVDGGRAPGYVSLVARDGKIVHLEAIGKRDVENNLPMEKDTIFRMFSMTKPVTAVAVMQLVEQGKISVDDPVSKYIPEFANMNVLKVNADGSKELVPAKTTITLRHLLTHTSGLSYGLFNPTIAPYYKEAGAETFGSPSLEEFAKNAAKVPLLFEPGTAWEYSIAIDVLGRIVEIASGEHFDAYVEKHIFKPLGMVDSAFYVPTEKRDRFAALYNATPDHKGMTRDDGFRGDFSAPPTAPSGGGGMVGTISDYYRFAQALLNGGELDGVRILGKEAGAQIVHDQLPAELGDTPLKFANFPLKYIGFGFGGAVVREGASQAIFGSPGTYFWGGYASTDFWIDPKENLVAIICTQLIPMGSQPSRIIFANSIYQAIGKKEEAGAEAAN